MNKSFKSDHARFLMICSILLFLCIIRPGAFAQEKEYVVQSGTPASQHSAGNIAGKPLASKVKEGLRIRVWLLTQDQHRAKASAFQSETTLEDKLKELLNQGTHYVLVNVTDLKTKKSVTDAEVWFHIVYPNKKNLMPRLTRVEDHFAGGVELSQKGKYTFMVHVNMGEKQTAITFRYNLK